MYLSVTRSVLVCHNADLSRAEGEARKAEEACSATLVRAKDAEKRLRKEVNERERVSAELTKVLRCADPAIFFYPCVCRFSSRVSRRSNLVRDCETLLKTLPAM